MFRGLFLDLLLMGWRWCASAMAVIKTPILLLVPKSLCNQFIHYHISSWSLRLDYFLNRLFRRRSKKTPSSAWLRVATKRWMPTDVCRIYQPWNKISVLWLFAVGPWWAVLTCSTLYPYIIYYSNVVYSVLHVVALLYLNYNNQWVGS